jgi:uncharacterized BrkB/YihY/UPF0761 family membrane protein
MKFNLILASLFTLTTVQTSALSLTTNLNPTTQDSQQQLLSQNTIPSNIQNLAQAITVKITSGDNGGSGIIVKKQGQT